jgi:glutathione reductase (NADPH)
MNYDYDLLVIGAGSGGIATARRAAEYGAKVAVAESGKLGGTCVNRGCIPKKLMVYSSRFPAIFTESQGYGWSPVQSSLNWQNLLTSVQQEVTRLNGIYQRMLDNSGVKLIPGYAKFVDPHTVEIGEQNITADKILIAVGARPVKPNIPGIEHTIVSDDMFNLPEQPKHIVVLGSGYIGAEFACIMKGLGSEVTMIFRKEMILNGFDDDLRTTIQEGMEHHGITILSGHQPTAIEKTDTGLTITLEGSTETTIIADSIGLAATGRDPNIEYLELEKAGVEVRNGAVFVDENSRTSQSNIFAVGDCTNRINLTPVAINEGRVFADTEFGNKPRIMSYDNIPTAIFTTPEAATVGLSEADARKKYGEEIKIYKAKFRPMYHTLSGQDEKTLMKLVVHQETDQVLGAHMVGEHAAEIIQGVAIAVKTGAKKADFDATIGIHPSAAEEFVTMR